MKTIKDFILKHINKKPVIFFDGLLKGISNKDITSSGASLTYFLILSAFPFLIALLNLINYSSILNSDLIFDWIEFLPADISAIILNLITELVNASSGGLLIISIAAGLFTASRGIKHLITKINESYGFPQDKNFLYQRIFALIITVALIVMIILLAFAYVFGEHFINWLRIFGELNFSLYRFLFNAFRFFVPMIYMSLIFLLLYRFSAAGENRFKLKLKFLLPGAIFTTLATILVTGFFGIYVKNFGKYSITYGSLGGIIVMLVWLYLMSTLILVGAEIVSCLYKMNTSPASCFWPERDSVFDVLLK